MKSNERERRNANNLSLLNMFITSKKSCVKLESYTQKTAASCVNSLRQSIRRFSLYQIYVIQRKGEVWLINNSHVDTLQIID